MRTATDRLSTTFFALADPTRRAILTRLTEGAATVKEIAAPFDVSEPAVCKHLRVLERAGLVRWRREAQRRPRTLEARPLREVTEWAERFRRFWDASYARLDAYLQRLQEERLREEDDDKEKPDAHADEDRGHHDHDTDGP